jgi:proliferating cell nuclear antigen
MVISISAFDKILSDIQVISDNITMETFAAATAAKFSGSSDNGNAVVTIDNDNNKNDNLAANLLKQLTVKENSKSSYNIDYISKIVKAISSISDDNMTLEFSSKKPLRLEFTMQGSLKTQFFLAPRVDN